MTTRFGIVYEIFNTSNNKRYIGSTVHLNGRKRTHLRLLRKGGHHSVILQNAFNKHGESAFRFIVIEDSIPKNQLIECEQYWIEKLQPEYNISPKAGTILGIKRSDEFKEKLRKAVTGRKHTPEAIEHMRIARKGHPVSEETRAKFRAYRATAETRAKISEAGKGRICTDETRAKFSAAFKGRKLSEKHRTNLSRALKGNKCALGYRRTEKECLAISAMKSKACRQIDRMTGEILAEWPSAKEAALGLGIGHGNVTRACRTKKVSGGYKWEYIDG